MIDISIVISIVCIWLLLTVNIILITSGYIYYIECENKQISITKDLPKVSIIVPAHNEAKVIVRTLNSLLNLNYPHDRYEIIIINDNSDDNSAELLENARLQNTNRNIKIINTDRFTGGKGKSNALNIGFKECTSEYIAVYDADNTPEKDALLYLVNEIVNDRSLGAVIGKFRTRNRNVNILTRFINIETLSFQWMAQAGRWKLFKLCTIPGTNFIIRRSILESIDGWDTNAIAEDTEISFRIYMMGYKIKYMPKSVTWEQEPQTVKVWFKQRTRWVKGNIYVILKNMNLLLSLKSIRIWFDILYFFAIYIVFLTCAIWSDLIFILNLFGWLGTNISGFNQIIWILAVILFILGTYLCITTEKGEMTFSNLLILFAMYFTYCKLWTVVAVYGLLMYLKDRLLKKESKWYKTERF